MDGSKIVLAEAMNLRAMAPAFTMGYAPTTIPVSHEDLSKYKSIWVKPITPDSFLQDELTGWYDVHDFYVQNQYGTRIKAGASSIAFMITSSSWTAPRLFWRKL